MAPAHMHAERPPRQHLLPQAVFGGDIQHHDATLRLLAPGLLQPDWRLGRAGENQSFGSGGLFGAVTILLGWRRRQIPETKCSCHVMASRRLESHAVTSFLAKQGSSVHQTICNQQPAEHRHTCSASPCLAAPPPPSWPIRTAEQLTNLGIAGPGTAQKLPRRAGSDCRRRRRQATAPAALSPRCALPVLNPLLPGTSPCITLADAGDRQQ